MNFFEAVEKRYSHKEKFLPAPVPLADLEQIAKAGLAAPSGINRQCVHLIILPDRLALQSLCDVHPTDGLLTAPAAVALLTNALKPPAPPKNFELEDYSAACENMLLACTALGYSSLWLDSPYFDEDKQSRALEALSVPLDEGYNLRAVLPVGKPDGEGSRREKLPFEQRVSYGKFGNKK